ncbi:hypothetical protein [Metabacillus sp. Hm71]|uniref:hypothetical protein n=1 Tax=Metabacillus sp. Hm71 TaxID=3450743 RepID=UPI003F434A1F
MAPKTYYYHEYILVPSSEPYPKQTFYKVSIGQQKVNDHFHDVLKIEMVYNDKLGSGGNINPAFLALLKTSKKC